MTRADQDARVAKQAREQIEYNVACRHAREQATDRCPTCGDTGICIYAPSDCGFRLRPDDSRRTVDTEKSRMNIEEPSLTLEQASALLMQWQEMQRELTKIKNSELLLRQRLVCHFFPDAHEGTNHYKLGHGYKLDATVPWTRDVDEEAIGRLDNQLKAAEIDIEKLIKRKPSLVLSEYRELTNEQQKVFDLCLTIKPGTAALKLVEPKEGT